VLVAVGAERSLRFDSSDAVVSRCGSGDGRGGSADDQIQNGGAGGIGGGGPSQQSGGMRCCDRVWTRTMWCWCMMLCGPNDRVRRPIERTMPGDQGMCGDGRAAGVDTINTWNGPRMGRL